MIPTRLVLVIFFFSFPFLLFASGNLHDGAVGITDSLEVKPVLAKGDPAPSFFRKMLDGGKFFLSDFCGEPRKASKSERRIVVLSFFASWCQPCKKEIPELENIVNTRKSDRLAVFLVNVGESASVVKAYLEENPSNLPVILDKEGVAAKKYCPKESANRYFLPTLVVISEEGKILHIKTGYRDGDLTVVDNLLEELLK